MSAKFWQRHRHLKHFLVGFCLLVLALTLIPLIMIGWNKWQTDKRQDNLQPFYDTSKLDTNGAPGEVVRQEPLNVKLDNGTAERILYRTQRADGSLTFSSGMVFIPNNSAAGSPRPVVAWAHGTVGMGDQCAPSRIDNPIGNINWVDQMLARGWVVTATDYAGLGTPGTQGYLVGGDEARDVLNSVRAVRNMPAAQAGNRYAAWGHSQGGHSVLFTAAESNQYAPELQLVGTAAAAPAAELVPLLKETSGTAIDWVIGPEVLVSWPNTYPGLDPQTITTKKGYDNYRRLAEECIESATLAGITRTNLKQAFFKEPLISVPPWRNVATAQTPPLPTATQPVMIAESTTDSVVLPDTTALYIERACQSGSNLTSMWVADVSHPKLAEVVAPQVTAWLNDRFKGLAASSNCQQLSPVKPATMPNNP